MSQIRTWRAEVMVKMTTASGEKREWLQKVDARCTDHATHDVCHNVKYDYPGASVEVKFVRWISPEESNAEQQVERAA